MQKLAKNLRIGMRMIHTLLLVLAMLMPGLALGASFDCAKVKSGVEKTICASVVLTSLDEQLTRAYKAALSASGNSDTVKSQQKEWLRDIRNKCQDESCLKDAYQKRLTQLAATLQVEWKTFRDGKLGVEFSYPSTRKVKKGCRRSPNCIALIGPSMSNSDYLIAFEVFDGDLEKIATANAVFEKSDKGWVARGRFAEYPVESLTGEGWRGIKSTVGCGVSDSKGFHAAMGECLWVALSNGVRSIVADTQGIVGNDEASLHSIQSIRFSK
jgi:uncharacterized protein